MTRAASGPSIPFSPRRRPSPPRVSDRRRAVQHVGRAPAYSIQRAFAFRAIPRSPRGRENRGRGDQDHGALVVGTFPPTRRGFRDRDRWWLVQHQEVGWLCQRAASISLAALAAREHFPGACASVPARTESLSYSSRMLACRPPSHWSLPRRSARRPASIRIEAFAVLVERRHFDMAPNRDGAAVRRLARSASRSAWSCRRRWDRDPMRSRAAPGSRNPRRSSGPIGPGDSLWLR